MARTPHWVRSQFQTTSPAQSAQILIDNRPTGWTLIRTLWQVCFFDLTGHPFSFYPGAITTYGLIATQGNPPPAPLSPSLNPGQDWLWYESVFFRRHEATLGSPAFVISQAPMGDSQRESEAQRLCTDVSMSTYFIADQGTLGGPFFYVQLNTSLLYLEP